MVITIIHSYFTHVEKDQVSVFNFYNYLRTHPLLLRAKLASHADSHGMRAAALLSGFSHSATDQKEQVSECPPRQ